MGRLRAGFALIALMSAQGRTTKAIPESVAQIVSVAPDGLGNIVAHLENTGTKTITGFVFHCGYL
jgi:hypothetical protein